VENKLVLIPAPVAERLRHGLFVRQVRGAYDRGGKRTNRIEAEQIVKAIAEHAKLNSELSLGVVTFSSVQRNLITEVLELARREDRVLDEFLREGKSEDVFVKSLENVQGDERDVILVSVGYGPRTAGSKLDSMAFGPVSTDGGERRLNVLFTRARLRTEVFVSFNSGDIDASRTKSPGARVLKRYLSFAETGQSRPASPTGEDPDSEFEVAVANVIRGLGYEVDYQVGSAGFKIDLAVRHPKNPGHYLMAVECDGAAYHSALWARERDRLRQEVLEGLGWSFHRVWSTDWFHRRAEEVSRLQTALQKASGKSAAILAGANAGAAEPNSEMRHLDKPEEAAPTGDRRELPSTGMPDYEIAVFKNWLSDEPHDVPIGKMATLIQKIVDVEGPIHQEEVSRRVAGLFGKQKAGSRIIDHVVSSLRHLRYQNKSYANVGEFWFTDEQKQNPPIRNRANAPLSIRRADMVPPLEIAAAIEYVLTESGAIPEEGIPRAVALLFGFQRTGPEFKPVIEPVIKSLIKQQKIVNGPAGLMVSNS
jgi:very-short-patch-repair endonuclease